MRPMDFMSPTELTAMTSNETTNGITVIRIAFTQRVPSGVTKSTARTRVGLPEAAMATPAPTAAARAMRTRVFSFTTNLVSRILKISLAQTKCAKMISSVTRHKINNCAS